MLIAKFFTYFVLMIICGISIIEVESIDTRLALIVGTIVTFLLAFSTIKQIEEQK